MTNRRVATATPTSVTAPGGGTSSNLNALNRGGMTVRELLLTGGRLALTVKEKLR